MTERPALWFVTHPEAVLRAESALVALHEDRLNDLGQILAADYADTADPDAPKHTLVALLTMCDRLVDFGARDGEHTHRQIIRETARTVAAAIYTTEKEY